MASSYQPIPPKIRVLPTVLNFMDGSRLHMKPQNSRNRSKNDIFDLLRRAVNQNLRVEVLTRDCRGIDGLLVGWLIAFDKHMNMVMSDVDQVFRRLTDGQDYLELGARRQDPVVERQQNPTTTTNKTNDAEDFQTFRAKLAQFLQKKKSQSNQSQSQRQKYVQEEDDNENHDEEHRKAVPCRPEAFLTMELLTIHNANVQRLSGKHQSPESLSTKLELVPTSRRPKVRFFSRHIPKVFVKGNQVCLIRLINA